MKILDLECTTCKYSNEVLLTKEEQERVDNKEIICQYCSGPLSFPIMKWNPKHAKHVSWSQWSV